MKHVSQADAEGYNLSKNRCECGTAHSHIQCKNEDWIKNCIYDGTDQHGNHRITRASVGENQLTHTGLAIRNGNPIATIRVYSCAKGRTSTVAPKNFSIGVSRMEVSANKISPKIVIKQIPHPA